ncbi:MAG: recombinase family protein [Candidatus Saccharimonadales bacterium]
MREIRKIDAIPKAIQRKRVAAYARVSSGKDAMLHSLSAQVSYYNDYIGNRGDWEFAGIYADEALTGTKDTRPEFQRMLEDCRAGKIDIVITKSITRFARNTVTLLEVTRELKLLGIDIFFEKENIYTFDAKGEVLITIMSSLAQEESRSISENITWGKRKSMKDGKVYLPYKRFLGYEKGEDDLPKIVESEAVIIRQIYTLFLAGYTYRGIADYLTEQGVPTPSGKSIWSVSTITSILSNEKYKGDALLQKSYTVDFLNKTIKKNEGEIPKIYIDNSHPAIILPETFDLVQSEIKRRKPLRRQLNSNSSFAAKIVCGHCGGFYGSKVWNSTSKYRSHIWRCNRKYADDSRCGTSHIREEEIKSAFVTAFNQVLGDKRRYIAELEELLPLLVDTSALEVKLAEAEVVRDAAIGRMRRYVDENTRQVQDQGEFERRFREMGNECSAAKKVIEDIKDKILEQSTRKEKIRLYLDELSLAGDIVTEFAEDLWQATVESVTVQADKSLTFKFRDGSEVPVLLESK